jgi:phosphate:Na+ symporter
MKRPVLLLAVFCLLAWGFRASPEFQTVAAGVAIFLLGMFALEQGFKAFSGGVLESFLRRTTDTTWKSLGFGIVSTTLMQSSSLVSVLTISFLSAGLIALSQGIGIIFGANLGTTTGAWLVAGLGLKVDIAAWALPMLVFGVIMFFQKGHARLQATGWLLVGLGFLFLGIAYMKEGFETASGQIDLARYAVPGFRGLLIYTAIGIAATVIMQSSHATLILTITALASDHVTYENALALAIGANVGTTITAMLGAISANAAGRRLAVAHLIFNLVTGAIAILLIHQFSLEVDWISARIGIAADNYTLKLALFHTLFNLMGVILMLPLIGVLVSVLEKLLRDKVEPEHTTRVLFLNEAALQLPDTALEVIDKETLHLAFNAFEILAHGLNLKRSDITSAADINAVLARGTESFHTDILDLYRRKVKPLYNAIIDFSARAEQRMNKREQLLRLNQLKKANWQIVTAIKAMKEIQDNIDRYMLSGNSYIRSEYNGIRLNIAILLRTLFRIEDSATPSVTARRLRQLQQHLETQDVVSNGTLDKLIREQRISPDMATSLMNDSSYAYNIQESLIAASLAIYAGMFAPRPEAVMTEQEVDHEIVLKRDEILDALRKEEARIDAITGRESRHVR